jgi:hypothetical protein
MTKKRAPREVLMPTPEGRDLEVVWDRPAMLSFWNEQGVGREQFLNAFQQRLVREGWKYSSDTGWTHWDYQIYGNRWWHMRLLSVTEEHGQGKRLTRVRLHPSPTTFSRLIGCVLGVISLLALLRFWATTTEEEFSLIGIWFCFISLFLAAMLWTSLRLRHRIAQVAELAAKDCKLSPLHSTK